MDLERRAGLPDFTPAVFIVNIFRQLKSAFWTV
jgi:hypothetical protein